MMNTLSLSVLSSLFAILLLVSCAQGATASREQLLETAVAETLTAEPTRTPPPTATVPATPSDVPLPTSTRTQTPTPGPSPTATAPILPSDDPRQGLDISTPDYRDDFSIDHLWGEFITEVTTNLIRDERLETVDHLPDATAWWSATLPTGGDVYMRVKAQFSHCSGKDAMGLGIRISADSRDGYTLEISCDGHYRIRRFYLGTVKVLTDWTFSGAIHQGPNAENRIGFVARGSTLSGFANNQFLGSVEDFYYTSGTFSLFANAAVTPDLRIIFDDFWLWYF